MKKMLFISRNQPTLEQVKIAEVKGYALIKGPEFNPSADRLTQDIARLVASSKAHAVACDNPATALAAVRWCNVGIFHQDERTPENFSSMPNFVGLSVYPRMKSRLE